MVIFNMALIFLLPLISIVVFMIFVWSFIPNNKKTSIKAFVISMSCIVLLFGMTETEFWKVDNCLDSGGRYNNELKICER